MSAYRKDVSTVSQLERLKLHKLMRSLGWEAYLAWDRRTKSGAFLIVKYDRSRRRNCRNVEVRYENFADVQDLAELIRLGSTGETTCSNDEIPSIAMYEAVGDRLFEHNCHLRSKLAHDGQHIWFEVSACEQVLVLNDWSLVVRLATLLDKGKPSTAKESDYAVQHIQEEALTV